MLGNGPGVPLTFLLVGALYLLFSAGFTAMSGSSAAPAVLFLHRRRASGPAVGVAGAMIALATYSSIELGLCGLFGFFSTNMVTAQRRARARVVDLPGRPAGSRLCLRPAQHRVQRRRARLLHDRRGGRSCCCWALRSWSWSRPGPAEAGPVRPFGPATLLPGLGMSLVFVVTAFVGFEATAIFGEEARDRGSTIPRATYIAVVLIALFYAFATWTIRSTTVPDRIQEQAALRTATLYLGRSRSCWAGSRATSWKGCCWPACSPAACLSTTRSIATCSRPAAKGLLWRGLGRTHPDHHSPLVAGSVQTAVMLARSRCSRSAARIPMPWCSPGWAPSRASAS
jgi:amino acid transporter